MDGDTSDNQENIGVYEHITSLNAGDSFSGVDTISGGFYKWYLHSWMVYLRENPIYKRLMTRGTPILGNHQLSITSLNAADS